MSLYLAQALCTADRWDGDPSALATVLSSAIERQGGRIHDLYAASGSAEVLAVYDAPDAASVLEVAGTAHQADGILAVRVVPLARLPEPFRAQGPAADYPLERVPADGAVGDTARQYGTLAEVFSAA